MSLSKRQRDVLNGLLDGQTVVMAADGAGVSRRQVHRWIKSDQEFKSMLRDAGAVVLDATGCQLLILAPEAVRVLGELLSTLPDRYDVPSVNLQRHVAVDVLTLALRWRELTDLEDRIAKLEEKLSG